MVMFKVFCDLEPQPILDLVTKKVSTTCRSTRIPNQVAIKRVTSEAGTF